MSELLKTRRFDALLLQRGQVTERDVLQAKRLKEESGLPLSQALLRLGAVAEDGILDAQSETLGLPVIKADAVPSAPDDFQRAIRNLDINARWLIARDCAVWQEGATSVVHIIARDILNQEIRELIEQRASAKSLQTQYYLASNQLIDSALFFVSEDLDQHNGDDETDADAARLREMAEEAPVIDFVNRVFSMALKDNASDIHIEPYEAQFIVRYRIDGVLHSRQTESRGRFDAVASRIKLLSGMDIAERRLPQDGRQSIRFAGQDIDLRVSSLPGTWGESLVLRLLRKENEIPDLEALGLEGQAKGVFEGMLANPNGIIIVTGPTGSGKSTTLYRSLQGLNDGIRKIITVEDPVEYDIDGIIQVQTNAKIGYTFANGLRAILRQDPDIIMVGEIRDSETATMAAQAALTGHLVLSTLHTNSALAGVTRLIDIGLEPYMVVSAVRGFVAQRLLRKLCTQCCQPSKNPDGEDKIWEMIKSGSPIADQMKRTANWHSAVGCEACSQTGYLGRVAIFEAVALDDSLSSEILANTGLIGLRKTARKRGFISLAEDGILKARTGVTSLAEVMRVCGQDSNFIGSVKVEDNE